LNPERLEADDYLARSRLRRAAFIFQNGSAAAVVPATG
jgi:hypothetical protein